MLKIPYFRTKWSELSCNISRSRQSLKNHHSVILASFVWRTKKITEATPNTPQNDELYAYAATKKKVVQNAFAHDRPSVMSPVSESDLGYTSFIIFQSLSQGSWVLTAVIVASVCQARSQLSYSQRRKMLVDFQYSFTADSAVNLQWNNSQRYRVPCTVSQ